MTATQSFTTRDGVKIAYAVTGEAQSQKRVLLIHSLAMDGAYWRFVAERLAAEGACCVALDCRGHGASDKPAASAYDVATFADDCRDLLDHLGWKKAVVAGSSMGGSVALSLGVRYPDRVAGLALIDTTAYYGDDAPKSWGGRADAALEKGLSSLIEFQLSRWFGDAFRAARPDVAKACVDTFLANDVGAYAATCRMLGAVDLRAELPDLKTPTRILVGEEDFATPPAMSEAMREGIAGATYRLLPKARHLTPLERPDEVAAEIAALL